MTLAERLKNERKKIGLSQTEFADKLGMNARTYASYERGERDISTAVLLNICKALNISSDTLLGNSEVKPTISFSGPNTSGKSAYMMPFANTVKVPLIGRVAAGLSCHAEDNIEGYILTDSELLHEGYEYFWLTVTGDSMEPELHDGDRVLVREQETLDSECFAVVRIDGEDGVVKRVRIDSDRITLTSINPYYPPRVFEREQMNTICVVGKVIQSQRTY
jgi:repressor LexA